MTTAKFNPHKHRRRSIRLRGYDYRQAGAYFVTICVEDRACLLGEVSNGEMVLSAAGEIVENQLSKLSVHFPAVSVDCSVVMPNHIHYIITLDAMNPASSRPSLGQTVGYLKYESTRQINILLEKPVIKFWQRNYYEHIVRNRESLRRLRAYIANNPQQWQVDQLHPSIPSKW